MTGGDNTSAAAGAGVIERREQIARIIEPVAYQAYASLHQYCLDHGDDAETAKRYADDTHGHDCGRALAKADAILALESSRPPVAGSGEALDRAIVAALQCEPPWNDADPETQAIRLKRSRKTILAALATPEPPTLEAAIEEPQS